MSEGEGGGTASVSEGEGGGTESEGDGAAEGEVFLRDVVPRVVEVVLAIPMLVVLRE